MICEEAAKPESEIIWWSLRLLHISPHHLHFHHKVNPYHSAIKSYYEEPWGGQDTSFDPDIQDLHIGFILHGEIHNS